MQLLAWHVDKNTPRLVVADRILRPAPAWGRPKPCLAAFHGNLEYAFTNFRWDVSLHVVGKPAKAPPRSAVGLERRIGVRRPRFTCGRNIFGSRRLDLRVQEEYVGRNHVEAVARGIAGGSFLGLQFGIHGDVTFTPLTRPERCYGRLKKATRRSRG